MCVCLGVGVIMQFSLFLIRGEAGSAEEKGYERGGGGIAPACDP